MRENKIEQYLKKRIERLGGLCIKFPPLFFVGFPDRIVLLKGGIVIFVETKTETGKPSPVQFRVIDALRKLGFRVEVILSKEEVDDFILGL
jgi:G:T-mismatch repair DNA endonuclease (very short patch repair protein)